jgi:hypothetical protein
MKQKSSLGLEFVGESLDAHYAKYFDQSAHKISMISVNESHSSGNRGCDPR